MIVIIIIPFTLQIDVVEHDTDNFCSDSIEFLAGAPQEFTTASPGLNDQNSAVNHGRENDRVSHTDQRGGIDQNMVVSLRHREQNVFHPCGADQLGWIWWNGAGGQDG